MACPNFAFDTKVQSWENPLRNLAYYKYKIPYFTKLYFISIESKNIFSSQNLLITEIIELLVFLWRQFSLS